MRRRIVGTLIFVGCALSLLAQPQPAAPTAGARPRASREIMEFPLVLKTKVVAGKTAVGTPIQGELAVPTLIRGYVIPAGAVFVGTVEESLAHENDSESRLKIRITEAKWSEYSIPVELYATGYLYPPYRPKPERLSEHDLSMIQFGHIGMKPPSTARTAMFSPRELMNKDVLNVRSGDGVIAVVSKKNTIHLDKGVVYCFEGRANK